jgi:hypothetical protein
MSFGVGFGDIAKAIGLAKEIITRYREAPKQVNDLATEYVFLPQNTSTSKVFDALAYFAHHSWAESRRVSAY